MKRWQVYTPQYECYHATEVDPPEYGADVIEVEAESRRDAIALGVRAMLDRKAHRDYRYCKDKRSDGESPYAGVKAELAYGEPCKRHNYEDSICLTCGYNEPELSA